MKLGYHISSAAPFSEAITRAKKLDCECMQIFVNAPQRWNPVSIPESEIDKFNKLNKKYDINPIIIHSIYLTNLATYNSFFLKASIASLSDDMKKAAAIGALGVNFHVGSTKGKKLEEVLPQIVSAIKEILKNSPTGPYLILENSAGAGNIIGDTLEDLGAIIKAVKSKQVKVLIDTAHAFESGYDLRNENGVENFLAKFEKEIGLEKLVGFHLNDSKTAFNSKKDRHADIGKGDIGTETFRILINHPKLKNLFGILETPQDLMSWGEQIEILKSMKKYDD